MDSIPMDVQLALRKIMTARFAKEPGTAADFSIEETIEACVLLMKEAEKFKNMNGSRKKDTVLSVLNYWVDQNVRDQTTSKQIRFFINNAMPTIIDYFILFDRKQLKIHLKKLAACCLG